MTIPIWLISLFAVIDGAMCIYARWRWKDSTAGGVALILFFVAIYVHNGRWVSAVLVLLLFAVFVWRIVEIIKHGR